MGDGQGTALGCLRRQRGVAAGQLAQDTEGLVFPLQQHQHPGSPPALFWFRRSCRIVRGSQLVMLSESWVLRVSSKHLANAPRARIFPIFSSWHSCQAYYVRGELLRKFTVRVSFHVENNVLIRSFIFPRLLNLAGLVYWRLGSFIRFWEDEFRNPEWRSYPDFLLMVAEVKTSVNYQTLSEADTSQHLPDRILSAWRHLGLDSADTT